MSSMNEGQKNSTAQLYEKINSHQISQDPESLYNIALERYKSLPDFEANQDYNELLSNKLRGLGWCLTGNHLLNLQGWIPVSFRRNAIELIAASLIIASKNTPKLSDEEQNYRKFILDFTAKYLIDQNTGDTIADITAEALADIKSDAMTNLSYIKTEENFKQLLSDYFFDGYGLSIDHNTDIDFSQIEQEFIQLFTQAISDDTINNIPSNNNPTSDNDLGCKNDIVADNHVVEALGKNIERLREEDLSNSTAIDCSTDPLNHSDDKILPNVITDNTVEFPRELEEIDEADVQAAIDLAYLSMEVIYSNYSVFDLLLGTEDVIEVAT